jgi:ATP-dependent DNA ligase
MLSRTRSSFIEPCLPSSAERPPSGPDWFHEINHDGYRLMARRPRGIRLLTRNGHDWRAREFTSIRRSDVVALLDEKGEFNEA